MWKLRCLAIALFVTCLLPTALWSQTDSVKYIPKYYDPVLEEMEDIEDSLQEIQDSITSEIRDKQEEEKEQKKEDKKELRFDFADVVRPASPEDFESAFHFLPVAQYRTGTCWSFSTTSFFESEVSRLTGQEIKLSEMHTVYYEHIEKVRNYVRERGRFWPGEGSESNAVIRMMEKYGIVPYNIYPGLVGDQERYDHAPMSKEIRRYLEYIKSHDYWDEEYVVEHVKVILNKYMGEPPVSFEYDGKTMTPHEFLESVLKLNLDDYISVMSTLEIPFYTQGKFDVHDNWWNDSSYYNLPLDEWYGIVKASIARGYTLVIGGDVSEPGWNGFEDACIVPDFDIPQDYINQDSREFRFYNHTTGDDHGLHLVGYTEIDGRDWFLIKDSGRSARHGQFEGYFFWRDDYVRLKMLTFTVHKDVTEDVSKKFE